MTLLQKDFVAQWEVKGQVVKTFEAQWSVESKLVVSLQLLWQIAQIPPTAAITSINETGTRVIRYAEIYEADGVTPWRTASEVDLIDGSVNFTWSLHGRWTGRRRVCDVVLGNTEGDLQVKPGELWYDKVIKLFRGTNYDIGGGMTEDYIVPLGEYMIDEIAYAHFPHVITLKGRDYTKRLEESLFKTPTRIMAGTTMEDAMRAVAIAGGIQPSKITIPEPTGEVFYLTHTWMAPTNRWWAIQRVVNAKGWEAYFSNNGYLVIAPQIDLGDSDQYEAYFTDGWNRDLYIGDTVDPNMTAFDRVRRDSRIKNVVVVVGEGANGALVYGVAENHSPTSPTSVEVLGEKVHHISTKFLGTNADAQAYAERMLQVMALEEFEVSINSVVYPWLDARSIVRFTEKNTQDGEPINYITSSITIPLSLNPMQLSVKRIVDVG